MEATFISVVLRTTKWLARKVHGGSATMARLRMNTLRKKLRLSQRLRAVGQLTFCEAQLLQHGPLAHSSPLPSALTDKACTRGRICFYQGW